METCQTCGGQIVGQYFEPCDEGIPVIVGNPGKCVQCGRPDATYNVPERIKFKSGYRTSKKEVMGQW